MIIQAESLHYINHDYDIVIIDEFMSVLSQFSSPFHRTNLIKNRNRFIRLIEKADYVVALDADINASMVDFLAKHRDQKDMLITINTYKVGERVDVNGKAVKGVKKAKFLTKRNDFDDKIKECLDKGERIAVSFGSKEDAKLLYTKLNQEYPELKLRLYTADTNDEPEEISNVNEAWLKFDGLIYSPVIGAGISFDVEHFDRCFVFGSSLGCTARDLKQMIGRIRNYKKSIMYVYIKHSAYNYPTTVEEIKAKLEADFEVANEIDTSLIPALDMELLVINGIYQDRIKPYDNEWVDISINQLIEVNKSRNDLSLEFAKELINLDYEVIIDQSKTTKKAEKAYRKELKELREELDLKKAVLLDTM